VLQVLSLVLETDRVFDIYLYRESGARLSIKSTNVTNVLEYRPAQVFFHEQEQNIALRGQVEAEETLLGIDAFAAGVIDDRTACGASLSSGVDDLFGLVVFHENQQ
jgi:hypothetical protein